MRGGEGAAGDKKMLAKWASREEELMVWGGGRIRKEASSAAHSSVGRVKADVAVMF